MAEDDKIRDFIVKLDALIHISSESASTESFNELKNTAVELLLEKKITPQDVNFVDNLGHILGSPDSQIDLATKSISLSLSAEVKKSICEGIFSSPTSRIWFVEIAVDKKSSLYSEAKKLLSSKSETEICEVIVESCFSLLNSKRWTTSKSLGKELKVRAALIPKSWTVSEFSQILRVAVELSKLRLVEPCGDWITYFLIPKKAVDIGQQIPKEDFDTALVLLQFLKHTPLVQKKPRGLLSILVSNSDENLKDLPDSIWDGVETDALLDFLVGIRGPRSVLISGAARDSVLVPALERKFSSNGKAWEYLKLITEFPELRMPQLSILVANKYDRSSREVSALTDFVDAFATEKIQTEIELRSGELEDQLKTYRRRFEDEDSKLRGELELLSVKYISLETQLREAIGANRGAHQAEIRQGRLDILREMINHLESLRLICPLLEGISSTAEELVKSIELSLSDFGVEFVGLIDSITVDNAEFFEYIGAGHLKKCRVISPAYLLSGEGGEKLVLRKGVCSPI